MADSVFNSQTVINEHISNADLRAYFVGYEYGVYRYDSLVDKIMAAIVDFAFGFHEGILNKYTIDEIKKAACLVYKIEDFDPKKPAHQVRFPKNHPTKPWELKYNNADEFFEAKYQDRGEFWELILHLLLRDFLHTIPLISKVYVKNSPWIPALGFDAVHIGNSLIDPSKKSLYLWESKLHRSGDTWVEELLSDIEKHFVRDFLTTPAWEFAIIGNKRRSFVSWVDYSDLNTKAEYEAFLVEKDEWFNKIDWLQKHESLQKFFESVTIPLLCTYTSDVFSSGAHSGVQDKDSISDAFRKEYEDEVMSLWKKLNDWMVKIKSKYKWSWEPISTNLNIVLMLFPIPDKKELVKRLHTKLNHHRNT